MAPFSGRIGFCRKPSGGGAGGIILQDHGAPLGTITTLDVEGSGLAASIAGAVGTITGPPPPPPAFGYWSGGITSPSQANTRVTNKLGFNTDTTAMTTVGLLLNAGQAQGCNSGTAGYFAEGFNNAPVAKLIFATDGLNMASPVSFTTNEGIPSSGNAVNSATKGYFAGFETGGGVPSNRCLSIDFAADVNPLVAVGNLLNQRERHAGANSATHGYFAGGIDTGTLLSSCDKLDFANDANPMVAAGALSGFPTQGLAGANSTAFAYFVGGSTSAVGLVVTTVNSRLDFANDVNPMVAKGALGQARDALAGANSSLKAYFSGGRVTTGPNVFVTRTDALTFASDAVAMASVGVLAQTQGFLAACQSGGIL